MAPDRIAGEPRLVSSNSREAIASTLEPSAGDKVDSTKTSGAATRAYIAERWEPFPFFGVVLVILIGAVCWVLVNFSSSPVMLSLLVPSMIFAIFALGVGFLIKQNGWVSFGHAAFFGLPAYATAIAFTDGGISPEIATIGSLFGTAVMAFLVALIVGRVSGIALGMLTLAIGQAFYELSTKLRAFGGSDGFTVSNPTALFGIPGEAFLNRSTMFVICWIALLVVILGLELLIRSPYGKLTEAIRDNEERVRFLGYGTLVHQSLIFAISALIVGVAGILSTLNNGFVSPDMLHWSSSGTALIMALLGGVTRVWGPVLGAIAYVALRDYLGEATEHWLAIVGMSLIVVVVAFPAGLTGLLLKAIERIHRTNARQAGTTELK
jgi:branched-chain amino acid transport system permease protein